MGNCLIILLLIELILINTNVICSDNNLNVLEQRLNKIRSFYANFDQQLIDINGNIIQISKGELWIKKPNLLNCHLIFPEEYIIISDGRTLWFYVPVIEQVTADWLKNFIDYTPLILIFSNKIIWNNYLIKRNNDNFLFEPKKINKNFQNFEIKIDTNGKVSTFKISELNGQCIKYRLSNIKNVSISKSKFQFKIPKNVVLDDRRS